MARPAVVEDPKRVHFIASKTMYDLLKQRAKDEETTPSDIVRRAVRNYLL